MISVLQESDSVWYLAYGSNLSAARFGCYLGGGRPPGARRTYAGCRDGTPPRDDVGLLLAGRLVFASSSTVWGGGMAFYDPRGDGEMAARAYLITFGQLSDVVAQEAKRPVGSVALGNEGERCWAVPSYVYETVMYVGDREGLPTYTITSLNELEPNPPSEAYLRTIVRGLGEAFSWTASQRVDYLLRARGITPEWDANSLSALCDGHDLH